jgi:hypothetical protein
MKIIIILLILKILLFQQQKELLTLFKNGILYNPSYIGKRDILFGKNILLIKEEIINTFEPSLVKVIDIS